MAEIDSLYDAAALTPWLDAYAPEIGSGTLRVGFMHGGTSNVILTLDRGGTPALLRRPPAAMPPNSEKAMMREARLLAALDATTVPHPHLFGYTQDARVIGAPFYVMEWVQGWAPELGESDLLYPKPFDRADRRREMGFAMVDALAVLAAVDHRAIGLADFGHGGNFLGRQADRWLRQLEGYPARYPAYQPRILPGLRDVAAWLKAMIPAEQQRGIVHGDFGPPNVLFENVPPTRVRAIVDWELATIGDPLLDLAVFLSNLRDESDRQEIPAAAYFDPTDFPMRQELIRHYAHLTGRDLAAFGYYLVLAQFRMACILEYKVAAAAGGPPLSGPMAIFPEMVIGLAKQARLLIETCRVTWRVQ
jgi:aminoglycoside phosphotransferase (APT) family kinase protein